MKRKVARAGAGFHFCKAGKHRRKGPFAGVKTIDDHLIETQIDGQSKAIVGRCANPVGVRAFLAFLVRTETGMLDETAGSPETSIFVNKKRGDAAAIVIGDQHVCPVLVEGNVTGSGTACGHLIEELESAGFRSDGKGAHGAAGASIYFGNLFS